MHALGGEEERQASTSDDVAAQYSNVQSMQLNSVSTALNGMQAEVIPLGDITHLLHSSGFTAN